MTNQVARKRVHFDASTQDYTSLNSRRRSRYERVSPRYSPGRYASPEGYEKEDHSLRDRGADIEVGPDVYDKGPPVSDKTIAHSRARERAMWLADVVYNEAFDFMAFHAK